MIRAVLLKNVLRDDAKYQGNIYHGGRGYNNLQLSGDWCFHGIVNLGGEG